MRILSSLRNRIFFATAALAVLAIVAAVYLVNQRVTAEAERTLQREIVETAALVDELGRSRIHTFTQMARFIADAPKLKAAVDTNDPPTVQDVADGYQRQLESNVLLVANRDGRVLATVGTAGRPVLPQSGDQDGRAPSEGRETVVLVPQPDGILQLVTLPITIGLTQPEVLGSLTVGFLLDNVQAGQLKKITGSDVAFALDGKILASTLAAQADAPLATVRPSGFSHLTVGDEDFVAYPWPVSTGSESTRAVAIILRSRTEQLRFLHTIHMALAATAVIAVVCATVLSFAVARTITRPLAAITDAMREIAATGDLTRKIAFAGRHRWDDEDARLLATTFNTLTESIGRFQREISQRERLSSLGRMSTVIAHEVRNPLMIIKASLHALGQGEVRPEKIREVVADINEEVARLNHLVNEVLDFARPIRFEMSETDLNGLCEDVAVRTEKAAPGTTVALRLDPRAPTVETDSERLRIVLVNLVENARQAVNSSGRTGEPGAISLTTAAGPRLVAVTVADRGAGIAAGDLARAFDPYFTTRRGGTGLGLPIAKNIVEGLGGTLTLSSTIGQGTEARIELPLRADLA